MLFLRSNIELRQFKKKIFKKCTDLRGADLYDLLQVGTGGYAEGVDPDPTLPPAAGVQQGRLEAHLPAVF